MHFGTHHSFCYAGLKLWQLIPPCAIHPTGHQIITLWHWFFFGTGLHLAFWPVASVALSSTFPILGPSAYCHWIIFFIAVLTSHYCFLAKFLIWNQVIADREISCDDIVPTRPEYITRINFLLINLLPESNSFSSDWHSPYLWTNLEIKLSPT